VYKIIVVLHSSEVSASSGIQVKIFCFTIAIVNKDHASEWIRTFITLRVFLVASCTVSCVYNTTLSVCFYDIYIN
jgi:hypothetical protein